MTRPKSQKITQIDNDRVTVTECRFAPGAETGWHRHDRDYVVVPLTTGNLLLETNDGEKKSELTIGKAYFRNAGVEHNVINANEHEFVFIDIEIK